MTMNALSDLKSLAREPYAWPGGYPRFAVMTDGEALCVACVRGNYRQVYRDTRDNSRSGWAFAGSQINWEDHDLICAHCNKPIESAYGD